MGAIETKKTFCAQSNIICTCCSTCYNTNTNDDFLMLNGALNVSAATNNESLDAFEYMRRMDVAVPGIFSKLDAWASHSYPQPNFSGSPFSVEKQ